ncbi:unnamed protein product [Urochloa humidicola]
METMSYPCSPLIPFPTYHDESSYLLWSPQVVIPLENGNMSDGDANPSPDQQQQDHELVDMMIQEANVFPLQDDLSNVDPSFTCFNQRWLEGQENGSLLSVQEEFMAESSLSDLLVAGAMAVEAGDSNSASATLSRLDDLIPGAPHRSCHHAAAISSSDHLASYFARGLRCRISGGAGVECHPAAAPAAPANMMSACRMLQELSPFIKFAHFTANQAILEATADDPGVHVIDLNVGEGVQWASFMSDLARHGGKPFHLTAVVTAAADEESDAAGAHPTAAARWLSEFAESLNLPFRYSSLHLRIQEDLHGFATTGNDGDSVIVSCDTTDRSYSSMIRLQMQLLGSVKILQPKLVILIEQELFRIGRNLAPFSEFSGEVLQHFTA